MSLIRGTNTGPERAVFKLLRREGVYFARHARRLPGSPDVLFRRCRLAVFIDGDFWHGRRLAAWRHGLTPYWLEKIERNKARDRRDSARLRKLGWTVVRLWAKDVERQPAASVARIISERQALLRASRHSRKKTT